MAVDDRRIAQTIASEIGARPDQVSAAAALLDAGATVPFVARYRKEATGEGNNRGQLTPHVTQVTASPTVSASASIMTAKSPGRGADNPAGM